MLGNIKVDQNSSTTMLGIHKIIQKQLIHSNSHSKSESELQTVYQCPLSVWDLILNMSSFHDVFFWLE